MSDRLTKTDPGFRRMILSPSGKEGERSYLQERIKGKKTLVWSIWLNIKYYIGMAGVRWKGE